MLFDHRLQDRGWLARYTRLERKDLPRYLRAAGFEELQFLRRYCAKLIYEVELYGGAVPWSALPDLYVETLTGADRDSATSAPTPSWTWTRASTRRATFVRGSCRRCSPRRSSSDSTPTGGATRRRDRGSCRNCFRADSANSPKSWRSACGRTHLSFAPLVKSIEGLLT